MVTQAFAQLEELFRAHQACVLKAAYRLTGNMADAEDVLQSVFLRLARGTVDASRISNLRSYLHKSAVNADLCMFLCRWEIRLLTQDGSHRLHGSPPLTRLWR